MSSPPADRHAVSVLVASEAAELAADRLFSLGATAVSEEPVDGAVRLVADLDEAGLRALLDAGEQAEVLERQDAWDHGWRAHARTWRCGERLVLRPAWREPEPLADGQVEVVVDPGGAFGSGSHPTTRLCLAAVDRLVTPGATVLDVGSGSGVLGVAAARLGATRVEAIDVDAEAVRATEEVAGLNGVGAVVTASATPLGSVTGRYDLVLANLLIPIIEELGADLVARLAPGGTLALSGLLVEHQDRALAAVQPLGPLARHELDGWIALEVGDPDAGARGSVTGR